MSKTQESVNNATDHNLNLSATASGSKTKKGNLNTMKVGI